MPEQTEELLRNLKSAKSEYQEAVESIADLSASINVARLRKTQAHVALSSARQALEEAL